MITATHEFKTEADAKVHGEEFTQRWGWGYDGSYTVYFSKTKQVWVCQTSRFHSCD